MKNNIDLVLAVLGGIAVAVTPVSLNAQSERQLLDDYCLSCHNFTDWAGGLALDDLDFSDVSENAGTWEMVIRKLRSGMMPPAGQERPANNIVGSFLNDLEFRLDKASHGVTASPSLHRLNRTEYQNVIRDLLSLNVEVDTLLPLDNASEGFDNVASGLGFSPALIQGYTTAAQKIARLAIGDLAATESATVYDLSPDLVQDKHIEGLPLGTRGGVVISHYFPVDAEYEFVVKARLGFNRTPSSLIDITLDGKVVDVEEPRRFRLQIAAGEHKLAAALVDFKHSAGVNDIYAEYSIAGSITGLEIHGPYNISGPGNTLARNKIFTCYPENNDEENACAIKILSGLAVQAFRGPLSDSDLSPIMDFYTKGAQMGGFEIGIQQALSRILIDPRFLFRFEEEPKGLTPGESYVISDLELASRLSFFLWSSMPDANSRELATTETLHQPATLSAEVQRLLADSKSKALAENFVGQWLHLRKLAGLTPETDRFNENLRQAFITETSLFVESIIDEDRPITELLNADYTFLNQRLAKHYGISGVYGDYFRRVSLEKNSPRRGLLGQASLLTITSTASRTSPVIRGSWILENLLHAPIPAPPPGVETNLDGDGTVKLTSSIRERLEAHRENPSCHSCHNVIDPVGFAMENFDMIGAWREYDGDTLVDASGVLVDGTRVSSPHDLRRALVSQSDLFVLTFTQKLLIYALGRKLEYYDMPAVRAIVKEAGAGDYRFSAIVNAIVSSPVFLQRTAAGDVLEVVGMVGE